MFVRPAKLLSYTPSFLVAQYLSYDLECVRDGEAVNYPEGVRTVPLL